MTYIILYMQQGTAVEIKNKTAHIAKEKYF